MKIATITFQCPMPDNATSADLLRLVERLVAGGVNEEFKPGQVNKVSKPPRVRSPLPTFGLDAPGKPIGRRSEVIMSKTGTIDEVRTPTAPASNVVRIPSAIARRKR